MHRWTHLALALAMPLICAASAVAQTITTVSPEGGKLLGTDGPRLIGTAIRDEPGRRTLVGRVESNVQSDLAPARVVSIEARDAAGKTLWTREAHLTTRAPLRHSRLKRSAEFRLTLPDDSAASDIRINLSPR